MKKSIAKILGLIALCCFITSCNKKDDPYFDLKMQLPTVIPFALDKAGNKAVIDFWVLSGRQDIDRGYYMLGFRFERHEGEDNIRDAINNTKVPLKVNFFRIKNDIEIPLGFRGSLVFSSNLDRGRVDINKEGDVVYPTAHALSDLGGTPTEEDIIAAFHIKEYGRYRVYIETTQNNNLFRGKQFDLFISDHNTGK